MWVIGLRRGHICIFIIGICLLMIGCQSSIDEDVREPEKLEDVSYDFYTFLNSPASTETQDLSHVIKVVVTKNEHSQDETLAFDVENEEIVIDPWMSSKGIHSEGETQAVDDVEEVLHILDTYNVAEWEEDYTTEDSDAYTDGVGWNVWLQYEDGTIQSYKGSGSGLEHITPEGFDAFFQELRDYVDDRVEREA